MNLLLPWHLMECHLFNLGQMQSWLVEYTDFLLKFMAAFTVGAGSPS